MDQKNLDSAYWNERHLASDTPWDIGLPSPPLQHYYNAWPDKSARVLVPGAGHVHEALGLLEAGFTNVTLCDISKAAIDAMQDKLPKDGRVRFLCADFFSLEGVYDLIFEQTFFCALEPALRKFYVQKMASLLAEDGLLVGLLFASQFQSEGPPFGGTQIEYMELFSNFLHIFKMEMCTNSIPQRQGNELFFIAGRLPVQ